MNDAERNDLLIRLDENVKGIYHKFDTLKSSFDKVSNGVGFPRCSDRQARLAALERSHNWFKYTFFGGMGILIASSILKGYI